MPLYLRKIIMWLFVLAFFIITPLVLLYTSGWNYNWKIGKMESTGVIIVDIQNPRLSTIQVENFKANTLLPFTVYHLNRLMPGEYDVKINKSGYFPWEKTIEVTGNIASFVDKVTLFRNNSAQTLITENIQYWFPAPERYAIYKQNLTNTQELWLFDAEDESHDLLYRQIKNPLSKISEEQGTWSKQSMYFLWKNNNEHLIFNINNLNQDPIDLDKLLLPNTIKQWFWHETNDNLLYLINNLNETIQISLNNQNATKLISLNKNVISTIVLDQTIYYLENNETGTSLYQNKEQENTKLMDFIGKNYQIKGFANNIFSIQDLDNKKSQLFVINKDQLTIQEINSLDLKLSPNKNKFTYSSNNFEIWTLENFYSLEKKGDDYLLTRLSQTPENLQWHSSNEYLYYTINNELKIIELDGRGNHRNIYTWTLNSKIKGIVSNQKHSILYLATENGLEKLVLGD